MEKLPSKEVEAYFSHVLAKPCKLLGMDLLGKGVHGAGYLVRLDVEGKIVELVIKFLGNKHFGHDYFADRLQVLAYANYTFNKLPKHVKAIDVGAITEDGRLMSLGKCREPFLVMEKARGSPYVEDLNAIKKRRSLTRLDRERALKLAEYLAEVHAVKKDAPWLYVRKLRDTVGHGECIMGIVDTYENIHELGWIRPEEFLELVKLSVEWWWRLRDKSHRLSRVHGDFHPFNIFFHGDDFTVLDRSRGEWGEPADDVTCLTVNYIWYSILTEGNFSGAFEELFYAFLDKYLELTGDREMFETMGLFYAFRCVVIANPLFYPDTYPGMTPEVRRKLINFALSVLKEPVFRPERINDYLEG